VIKISNLSVSYSRNGRTTRALDDISIHIRRGEICVFIGPSGCGKSTLLYVLSGIMKDYIGDVAIDGRPVDPKTQRTGLVLQNYGLLPWKKVRRNALLGAYIKDGRKDPDEYSSFILKELGIDGFLHRYPRELSGGQQQRVAIARAFILRPDLLLMDEPFSALDAITREDMQELFLHIWEQHRVTTVFITHSVDEALYLGGRIVVFSPAPGRVIEVLDNPCFQKDNLRFRDEYHEMSNRLRQLLHGE
jgi:NitT/TauT family transport system ATP-binding protein